MLVKLRDFQLVRGGIGQNPQRLDAAGADPLGFVLDDSKFGVCNCALQSHTRIPGVWFYKRLEWRCAP